MSQQEILKLYSKTSRQSPLAVQEYALDTELKEDTTLELFRSYQGQELKLYSQLFSPRPVVTDEWPISNFKFFWNSNAALEHTGTFPSKLRHPDDPVILFSNASSVKNHVVTEDHWLQINSGGGNGRIYLELYEIPEFKTLPQFQNNVILTGKFKRSPKNANVSIKYGNHGTTGYLWDKKTWFGGFGQALEDGMITSKAEYNHDEPQEKPELKFDYPSGKDIADESKEYRFFTAYISDKENNTMTLNTWIMFDIEQEKKWYHVMNDRIWKNDSKWSKGLSKIPSKMKDYALKTGPAMGILYHIWMRANRDKFWAKEIYAGTVI